MFPFLLIVINCVLREIGYSKKVRLKANISSLSDSFLVSKRDHNFYLIAKLHWVFNIGIFGFNF